MPGTTPPISQLDWLISTTAMIVLSWSNATRELLRSFSWGIRALHQLDAATMVPSPRRLPIASPRWREQDSNPRSLSGTLPGPAHARLPNAARTLCLGAVVQELPLHRVHLGDICRDVVVTAPFAGD